MSRRATVSDVEAKTLLRLLALAHRRMDALGYPPAPPRPVVRHES